MAFLFCSPNQEKSQKQLTFWSFVHVTFGKHIYDKIILGQAEQFIEIFVFTDVPLDILH